MSRFLAVLVAIVAVGFAGLKYGLYERIYDNGLGFASEPSDVFRVTKTTSLTGRNVLVTGCKVGGIGFETAFALANIGAHVFVHTRSLDASRQTIAALLQRNGSLQLTPVAADLSDLDDVVRMTREFPNVPLDLLFLNAAVLYSIERATTAQNIELMVGVNHVAHALLALRLLPQLRQVKGGARVVVVSSDLHRLGNVAILSNSTLEASPYSMDSYQNSKLLNAAFAHEFDRRHAAENIRAITTHPGLVSTGFREKLKSETAFLAKFMSGFLWLLDRVLSKSLTQGTSTLLYAALGPASLGGKYLEDCQPTVSGVSAAFADRALMEKFWSSTLALIGPSRLV